MSCEKHTYTFLITNNFEYHGLQWVHSIEILLIKALCHYGNLGICLWTVSRLEFLSGLGLCGVIRSTASFIDLLHQARSKEDLSLPGPSRGLGGPSNKHYSEFKKMEVFSSEKTQLSVLILYKWDIYKHLFGFVNLMMRGRFWVLKRFSITSM